LGDRANIVFGAVTSISLDGTDIGFTTGGVTYTKQKEHTDVELDQVIGVGKKYKSMERLFVETTLAEATLANLQRAFDEPAGNMVQSGSQLDIGGNSATASEHTMTLVGKGPNSGTRTFSLYIVVSVDETAYIAGSRTEAGTVPVRFECLKDPDQGYKFGAIVDS